MGKVVGLSASSVRRFYYSELEICGAGVGRPLHQVAAATVALVEQLAAGGARTGEVAAAIGISQPTLRKHYAAALARGRARRPAEGVGSTDTIPPRRKRHRSGKRSEETSCDGE